MANVRLPEKCAIETLAGLLGKAGALDRDWQTLTIRFPREEIDVSALTFLCAWGRRQTIAGRRLLFHGDPAAIKRLASLNLHEHLGLAYARAARNPGDERFVPLRLLATRTDSLAAIEAVEKLVNRHFSNHRAFLPALRWALQEILDNVFTHADADEPGAMFCEYRPRSHRLELAICDLGRGIYATLGETVPLLSHGHAITTALQRGITRSEEVGQGNGLAGVLEIVKRGSGDLRIWSGDAVVRVVGGSERGFINMPELPGTGVALSLDTRKPVDLQATWIAGETGPGYLGSGGDNPGASSTITVASDVHDVGSRASARELRSRVTTLLAAENAAVTLDFTGVAVPSSSFLDELFGRLAREIGEEDLRTRVRLQGVDPLVERMAEVVIDQRLRGLSTRPEDEGAPERSE